MKKFILSIILLSLISSFSFANELQIDEDIDPISLDLLYRNGLISLEDKERLIEDYIDSSKNKEDKSESINHESKLETENNIHDEFFIKNLYRIGESAIKITFSQELDERALSKAYYKIYKNGDLKFNYPDFDVRNVSNDNKSVVIRLKDNTFERATNYELRISNSLKSKYDIRLDGKTYYLYDFTTSDDSLENKKVVSYEVYDEGFIDVGFEYEVTDEFLKNKHDYKINYNDGKFMRVVRKVELLEDSYGICNSIRLYIDKFDEKYDYTLDLSRFDIENAVYIFPGGATLSRSFSVYEIDIIDNYTLDVSLSSKIEDIGSVRIKNGPVVDNFTISNDRLIINLDKDAGLSYFKNYNLVLLDVETEDGRFIESVGYDFATDGNDNYKDHMGLKVIGAKKLGENFIELSFNKPVVLDNSINAYLKINSLNYEALVIDSYVESPYRWIIKTEYMSDNEEYKIYIKNLPEPGKNFRSDNHSITVD